MGRHKLGAEYKKPSDYHYDYPENKEVAKHLCDEDRKLIAIHTAYTLGYVNDWCLGRRKNKKIETLARYLMRINIAKQRKLTAKARNKLPKKNVPNGGYRPTLKSPSNLK
jgi:hypothetical protein